MSMNREPYPFHEEPPTLTPEEIGERLVYHTPSEHGVMRHAALTDAAAEFMRAINVIVPKGREQSLAFTAIENAKMWASAGVARNITTC